RKLQIIRCRHPVTPRGDRQGRRRGHRVDVIEGGGDRTNQLSALCKGYLDRLVTTARDQQPAVDAPGYGTDPVAVHVALAPRALGGGHKIDGSIGPAQPQFSPIRREPAPEQGVLADLSRRLQLECFATRTKQTHFAVLSWRPADGGEQLAV